MHNIYSPAIILPGLFYMFFAILKIPHIKHVKMINKIKKGRIKNEVKMDLQKY